MDQCHCRTSFAKLTLGLKHLSPENFGRDIPVFLSIAEHQGRRKIRSSYSIFESFEREARFLGFSFNAKTSVEDLLL